MTKCLKPFTGFWKTLQNECRNIYSGRHSFQHKYISLSLWWFSCLLLLCFPFLFCFHFPSLSLSVFTSFPFPSLSFLPSSTFIFPSSSLFSFYFRSWSCHSSSSFSSTPPSFLPSFSLTPFPAYFSFPFLFFLYLSSGMVVPPSLSLFLSNLSSPILLLPPSLTLPSLLLLLPYRRLTKSGRQ